MSRRCVGVLPTSDALREPIRGFLLSSSLNVITGLLDCIFEEGQLLGVGCSLQASLIPKHPVLSSGLTDSQEGCGGLFDDVLASAGPIIGLGDDIDDPLA